MSRNSNLDGNLLAMRSSARSSFASSSMSKAPSKAQLNGPKSEDDHESQEEEMGSCRETPMSARQPQIIYHDEVQDIRSSIVVALK